MVYTSITLRKAPSFPTRLRTGELNLGFAHAKEALHSCLFYMFHFDIYLETFF